MELMMTFKTVAAQSGDAARKNTVRMVAGYTERRNEPTGFTRQSNPEADQRLRRSKRAACSS
jgi:hypothetical protein